MVKALFSVFFSFCTLVICGQTLREFEYKQVNVPELENVVQADTRYPSDAMVFVYSTLPELVFRSSMGIHGQVYDKEAGYYRLLVPSVRQILQVLKQGFRLKEIQIDVAPKQVVAFEVKELVAPQFNPGWAELRIKVMPADAEVTLNGRRLRMVEGEINFRGKDGGLPPGNYELTIEKENHRSEFRRVELKGGDQKRVEIQLEPFVGKLSVRSFPSGADVTLDGKSIGQTPYDGNQMVGSYKLRLKLKDHLDDVRDISVDENRTTTVSADLFNFRRAMQPTIRARQISIGVGAAGIAAGTYFMFNGISNLSKYNSATTNAADYRRKAVRSMALWPVSMLIGGAGVGGAFYFHRKLSRQKSEYNLSFFPAPGGGEVTLQLPIGNRTGRP